MQVLGSQDAVEAVLKCLPSADEALKLAPYLAGTRPLSDLVPAERFLLELHRVPQARAAACRRPPPRATLLT